MFSALAFWKFTHALARGSQVYAAYRNACGAFAFRDL